MTKRKTRKKKVVSPVYINGEPYSSLTPLMDKIDETKRLFLPSEDDLEELRRTPASPLDSYFLGVADKHGIDLMDDGDYGDEP